MKTKEVKVGIVFTRNPDAHDGFQLEMWKDDQVMVTVDLAEEEAAEISEAFEMSMTVQNL